MNPSLNFSNDLEIRRALNGLAEEIRHKALPRALKAAGQPIVRHARRNVPVDRAADPAGTLKRSLGLELRQPRRGSSYVAFGARRGFARWVARPIVVKGEIRGGYQEKADPANYAHLVEGGHTVVVPKKGTSIRKNSALLASGKSYVAARPFLRPAMLSARLEVKLRLIEELNKAQARYLARQQRRAARAA